MGREPRKRRYRADCPALILVPDLEPAAAVALDVSLGGSFLETEAALPLGLELAVRYLPPGRPDVTVPGMVLRSGITDKRIDHPQLGYLRVRVRGLGVKFRKLDPLTEATLSAYLATLKEI